MSHAQQLASAPPSQRLLTIPEPLSVAVGRCLERLPTIVLGSGASAAHGVPGMPALQEHLVQSIEPKSTADEDAWLLVRTALNKGDDLEAALSTTLVPDRLSRDIIRATWSLVANSDADVFEKIATGSLELPLTRLLRWLTRSTRREVTIVTTNYDRLAEFAADAAGMVHLNGFAPGYLHERENSNLYSVRRGPQLARTAKLWKVHGSLDWFERNDNRIICARFTRKYPAGLQPVIVTPGVEKYQRTHLEPFRTVMSGADTALEFAAAVLCIGYGFRDTHIEPKLVDRCKDHDIPIVVLGKSLTAEARSFLERCAGRNHVALEEAGDDTRAITPDNPGGIIVPSARLWDLGEFLDHFVAQQ